MPGTQRRGLFIHLLGRCAFQRDDRYYSGYARNTGDVLATNTVEVKGAGKTPEKAMISALKTIKPNEPGFKRMLDRAAKKLCPEPPVEAPAAEDQPVIKDTIAQ